jgi:predicted GIY-YIG superfamily endonuclease
MVYILQFTEKLGNPENPRGTAQFYVGYCDDNRPNQRLAEHRAGRGAAITRAATERGIGFDVVLTLPGDRATERAIKNRKNTRKFVQQQLRAVQ